MLATRRPTLPPLANSRRCNGDSFGGAVLAHAERLQKLRYDLFRGDLCIGGASLVQPASDVAERLFAGVLSVVPSHSVLIQDFQKG